LVTAQGQARNTPSKKHVRQINRKNAGSNIQIDLSIPPFGGNFFSEL
jgi:hypothetical protein